jgi:hypothetical protein
MQGFAALLGIALTATLISVQLAANEYGTAVGTSLLFRNRSLLVCLIGYVSVLLLSGIALAWAPGGPAAAAMGGVLFLLGCFSLASTVVAAQALIQGVNPEFYIRSLARPTQRPVEAGMVFRRLADGGLSRWTDAWGWYLDEAERMLQRADCDHVGLAAQLALPIYLVFDAGESHKECLVRIVAGMWDGRQLGVPHPHPAWVEPFFYKAWVTAPEQTRRRVDSLFEADAAGMLGPLSLRKAAHRVARLWAFGHNDLLRSLFTDSGGIRRMLKGLPGNVETLVDSQQGVVTLIRSLADLTEDAAERMVAYYQEAARE